LWIWLICIIWLLFGDNRDKDNGGNMKKKNRDKIMFDYKDKVIVSISYLVTVDKT